MPNTDGVYYRVLQRGDGTVTVVCMQDFDEHDYDQESFVTSLKFEDPNDAWAWCNRNCVGRVIQRLTPTACYACNLIECTCLHSEAKKERDAIISWMRKLQLPDEYTKMLAFLTEVIEKGAHHSGSG